MIEDFEPLLDIMEFQLKKAQLAENNSTEESGENEECGDNASDRFYKFELNTKSLEEDYDMAPLDISNYLKINFQMVRKLNEDLMIKRGKPKPISYNKYWIKKEFEEEVDQIDYHRDHKEFLGKRLESEPQTNLMENVFQNFEMAGDHENPIKSNLGTKNVVSYKSTNYNQKLPFMNQQQNGSSNLENPMLAGYNLGQISSEQQNSQARQNLAIQQPMQMYPGYQIYGQQGGMYPFQYGPGMQGHPDSGISNQIANINNQLLQGNSMVNSVNNNNTVTDVQSWMNKKLQELMKPNLEKQ